MNAVEMEKSVEINRKENLKNHKWYWIGRRTQDVILSLAALVVLSPLMLVTAIAIVVDDPSAGPIFSQVRIGRNGKPFKFYKFRSMCANAEAKLDGLLEKNEMDGPVFKIKDDPRITRVGKFIRKTSIDELPQLWNILKGDMSLVGPRPERPEFIAKAVEDIPEFVLRTKVKAGLTGYAQVMGNYNTSFLDKLKWDLMYIENYSLFLDLKILLMTAIAIFAKDNHEDFSKWDML